MPHPVPASHVFHCLSLAHTKPYARARVLSVVSLFQCLPWSAKAFGLARFFCPRMEPIDRVDCFSSFGQVYFLAISRRRCPSHHPRVSPVEFDHPHDFQVSVPLKASHYLLRCFSACCRLCSMSQSSTSRLSNALSASFLRATSIGLIL